MGTNMKILCYFGGFARMGGCEIFAANLLAGLKGKGVERELVYWETSSSEHPILKSMTDDGVAVVRSSFKSGCRFRWPDWVLFARSRRAVQTADVVVLVKLFTPSLHRALRRRVHRAGGRIVFITDYRPGEKQVPLEILATFDAIIVQSPDFEADLRGVGYTGTVSIAPYILRPNVPPVRSIDKLPACQPVRIGYLGRLVPDKNLAYLLESFALLVHDLALPERHELHLYGDGPEAAALLELAKLLRIEKSVFFHGMINRSAVVDAIDSCHCFALSSTTEGQCLAALEILSRGRPMVATPVGALPDILSDGRLGLLAPLNSTREYARTLHSVCAGIRSEAYRAEAIKSAFDERFGYLETLDRYMDIFRRVKPTRQPQ